MRPVAAALRGLVFAYRVTLSPLIGRQCRYFPTCSEYADEALRRHGAWRGGWLTLARILRCNPFGASGFDPVPDLPPDAARRPWRHARWTGRHIPPEQRLDL
ncbi:membrane protein insertion efficiency factor YidD [Acuticoccus sp. MNP-M23]|uniref:membrane protein insertion efficiency factor YidD n=1 Tax=Acuticoccus sp. MNP-M23 TaxID=3072793 RepID=UPI0028149F96|nr:membrane protein insertion efficiency factor YidD [Acuticoccus sp. MNP-M23]WMS42502.1 membrane protein insertion efficiency factor YidD [Acuticoccus sp. MNP-M23]